MSDAHADCTSAIMSIFTARGKEIG